MNNENQARFVTFTFRDGVNKPSLTTSEALACTYTSREGADEVRNNIEANYPDIPALVVEEYQTRRFRLRVASDPIEQERACEWCARELVHRVGPHVPLHLLACSGGAAGDIFACDPHWKEHLTGGSINYPDKAPCFDCAPPKGQYETKAYLSRHDADAERDNGPADGLTVMPAIQANRPIKDERRSPEEAHQNLIEREQREQQRNEESRKKAADVARIAENLRVKYPWARSDEGISRHARAAANLRTELSIAFPGVRFSVKSESYSGGSSVNYKWTLGPSSDEVSKIADKYRSGTFDSMTDCAGYDSSNYGEAVDAVLGRARHTSGSRELPADVREQVGRLLCVAQKIEYQGDNTRNVFGEGDYNKSLHDHVYEILAATSFPVGAEVAGIEWRQTSTEPDAPYIRSGYYLTFSEPVPVSGVQIALPLAIKSV